ncbi:MAG: DUF177 domain-containing protein [Rubrivivax sp.]|nr:DUF177 domain-containing protein [Rubrivivax sp.]
MAAHHGAAALNVTTFCEQDSRLDGHLPLAAMARLLDSLYGQPTADAQVAWSASGSCRPMLCSQPTPWLQLRAEVPVMLQCQRCLQGIAQRLRVDRAFRFVRTEAEAEALDDIAEEDVLVLPQRLDLPLLIEDELILALPLVPRHDGACPEPLPLPADDLLEEDAAPHPFAALAAMRGKPQ